MHSVEYAALTIEAKSIVWRGNVKPFPIDEIIFKSIVSPL